MKKIVLSVLACGYLVAGINDGLVAHYEFEGNADDSSGNGNNGTVNGLTSFENGVIGNSVKFNGEYSDNIEVSYSTSNNLNSIENELTISYWIKKKIDDYGGAGIDRWHWTDKA